MSYQARYRSGLGIFLKVSTSPYAPNLKNPDLPNRPKPSAGALPKSAELGRRDYGRHTTVTLPSAKAAVRFVFSDTPAHFASSIIGGEVQAVPDAIPALCGVGDLQ